MYQHIYNCECGCNECYSTWLANFVDKKDIRKNDTMSGTVYGPGGRSLSGLGNPLMDQSTPPAPAYLVVVTTTEGSKKSTFRNTTGVISTAIECASAADLEHVLLNLHMSNDTFVVYKLTQAEIKVDIIFPNTVSTR